MGRGVSSPGTRGARTRAAVLAAARARFAAAGFEGTTGAAIAADAGVSEPTIAFHFGGKAGLLVAVMRAYYEDLLEEMDTVLDAADGPVDRLREFARWWVARNDANAELMAVFGRQGRGLEADEVTAAFLELNRAVTRRFDRLVADLQHAGLLGEDVPRSIIRDTFFGGTEHIMLGRRLTGRPEDLAGAADQLVTLMVGGAGPGGAGPGGAGGPALDPPTLAALDAKLDQILDRLGSAGPMGKAPHGPSRTESPRDR